MARILIIDDVQSIRAELRDRIESMGHDVDEAGFVDEALKCVQEMAYDCILLDLEIPRSFEGPTSTNYGQTLLHRIVGLTNAPVLVITGKGLDGWQLATSVLENGAKGFIPKPFKDQTLEEKIRFHLNKRQHEVPLIRPTEEPFSGGELVLHEDRIELCGIKVGGTRGNALIRQILTQLSRKNSADRYIKASGKELAQAIGRNATAPSITAAIAEFREKCSNKLVCDTQDVIVTDSRGYHLCDKIVFRHGSEGRAQTQPDADQGAILRAIRTANAMTSRQIANLAGIPLPRVKSALSKLGDEKKVSLNGSGANAVYSIRETP